MTDAFKRDVRARMATTGEKYTQARRVLLAERDALAATAREEHWNGIRR